MSANEALSTVARVAKGTREYDQRLDSENVIDRQQAEIEALRTCLIASNSESNGEYERLRCQIQNALENYEAQKRNTLAFAQERAAFADHLKRAREHLSDDGALRWSVGTAEEYLKRSHEILVSLVSAMPQ